jgi:hypothetical protein
MSLVDHDDNPTWDVLNDWLLIEHRATFEACRYLEPTRQYECHLAIWKLNGCPDLSLYEEAV